MDYCPSCGEECGKSDKFCRSCGENLSQYSDQSVSNNLEPSTNTDPIQEETETSANRTIGWSIIGSQPLSIGETLVILSVAGVIISITQPWLTVEGGDLANNIAGSIGAEEITPKGSYPGYETIGGKVSLVSAGLILVLAWVRQWDVLTAFGSFLLSIGVLVGTLIQRQFFDTIHSEAAEHGTWGAHPTQMPDGTYAPLEAVEPGMGLIFTFLLSLLLVVLSFILLMYQIYLGMK